jgi:hypothetical protein
LLLRTHPFILIVPSFINIFNAQTREFHKIFSPRFPRKYGVFQDFESQSLAIINMFFMAEKCCKLSGLPMVSLEVILDAD